MEKDLRTIIENKYQEIEQKKEELIKLEIEYKDTINNLDTVREICKGDNLDVLFNEYKSVMKEICTELQNIRNSKVRGSSQSKELHRMSSDNSYSNHRLEEAFNKMFKVLEEPTKNIFSEYKELVREGYLALSINSDKYPDLGKPCDGIDLAHKVKVLTGFVNKFLE